MCECGYGRCVKQTPSFNAKYSYIVKVKAYAAVVVSAAHLLLLRLSPSVNTPDKIPPLLSMTDFEFMTPH